MSVIYGLLSASRGRSSVVKCVACVYYLKTYMSGGRGSRVILAS